MTIRATFVIGALSALWLAANGASANDQSIAAGEYAFRAAGCISCHTDVANKGVELAGGRALKTPFGTFYTPNITPDKDTGIGSWSDEEFLRALREGVSPDGDHYYPSFPYTSYTFMSDEDVLALKAYLFSREPAAQENREHDLGFPFNIRLLMLGWKLLFFEEGPFAPEPDASDTVNRGAYLVVAQTHCGECHTPRNPFGATIASEHLAGNANGPDNERVPNITPDATGIGRWNETSIVHLLRTGFKPNWDNVQGSMAEAVAHGLKYLSEDDLKAIAAYLKWLPPIENVVPTRR